MIPEIQGISRPHGEKDTMLIKNEKEKRGKLSREILGLFGGAAAVSVFFYAFLSMTASSLVAAYCEQKDLMLDEAAEILYNSWIQSISIGAAGILFVILFLTLVGRKITYLKDIIYGIEALRAHRMDYQIPLEGDNEFTELAESINYLSKTERELQEREKQIQKEREEFVRTMSHDIRTPLTTIISYTEYMKEKDQASKQELDEYFVLMEQKAGQIKMLTDQLLDGKNRCLEKIENGKLLMEQLADEWVSVLEDDFLCRIDLKQCPDFSCEVNVQELCRIFDNLASNVEKYADPGHEVVLEIDVENDRLCIEQKNVCKTQAEPVESHKIGVESIRKVARQYGGQADVYHSAREFRILITLMNIR